MFGVRTVGGDAREELVRARDVLRVVHKRDGLERTARVSVGCLAVAAFLAEESLRTPESCARQGVLGLVACVDECAKNLGRALRLASIDEHVREQYRVPKPLERVIAFLGVGKRLLEHTDSSLQIAELCIRAPKRIRDRKCSLRMRRGGFL